MPWGLVYTMARQEMMHLTGMRGYVFDWQRGRVASRHCK
jgi:hypothetical protein